MPLSPSFLLHVLVEAVLLYPGRREQVTSNLFSFLFLSPR